VALIVSTENVGDDEASPLEPRLDEAVGAGEAYRAVGFGATSGNGEGTGVRRQRVGLKASCAEGGECGFVSDRERDGQAGVCEGDSGGPALDGEAAARSGWSARRSRSGRVVGAASPADAVGLCSPPSRGRPP
jgi:hypothetical protein